MGSLRGKVAIVTGASRGIGKAIALALAKEGMRVGLVARSEADLGTVAQQIEQAGSSALTQIMDLEQLDRIPDLACELGEVFGQIHCLVNNAGTFVEQSFDDLTIEQFDHMLKVNLMAPFILTRELLPLLRADGGGRVINIVSTSAVQGYSRQSGYCASKHGLLGLMRGLALEVKSDHVHVHNLCPGGVDTAFIDGTDLGRRLAGQVKMVPEDIAALVVFLLKQSPNIDLPEIVLRRFSI